MNQFDTDLKTLIDSIRREIALSTQLAYEEAKNFAAVANVNLNVVPGLVVTPEVLYTSKANRGNAWGGMIRFQRSC